MPSGPGLELLGEAEAPPRKLSGFHTFPGGPLSSGPLVILVRLGRGAGGWGHMESKDLRVVPVLSWSLSSQNHLFPTPLAEGCGPSLFKRLESLDQRRYLEEACQSGATKGRRRGEEKWGGG